MLQGSSGVVYKCAITLANGNRMQNLVIKLPSRLLQTQVLSIHREDGLLIKTLTDKELATQESAVRSLKHEFEIFEMLWEPRRFTALFGGGALGQHLPKHSLRLMQQELKEMKALPGRRHIHEYLHFDADIPMILTELCDGNLWDLRAHQKPLFLGLDHPTSLVMRLGLQIAYAMSYMREQNVVHTDMKLENVFYKRDPHTREIVAKVSDFGGCPSNDGPRVGLRFSQTIFYTPIDFPREKDLRDPMALSVYEFAVLMCEMLAFTGQSDWPPHLPWGQATARFATEIDQWLDPHNEKKMIRSNFMPHEVTSAYRAAHPLWQHMADILCIDYSKQATNGHFEHIEKFIDAVEEACPTQRPA